MSGIKIEHNPDKARLDELGVDDWALWEMGESTFHWTYDATEICLFLEGEVTVTPDGEEPVTICAGDLVTFPYGMVCTWDIKRDVRKRYKFI